MMNNIKIYINLLNKLLFKEIMAKNIRMQAKMCFLLEQKIEKLLKNLKDLFLLINIIEIKSVSLLFYVEV